LIALGFKFFIAADEKLTIDGFGWLKKLILLKSFLVTDQTGKMPDAASLDNEWLHSLDSDGGESGPTKIFIENKTLNCEKILSECKLWDSRGLLMPFFNDYSNDLLP